MNLNNIWRVHFPRRVAKDIKKFPKGDHARIVEMLRDFENGPWAGDVVKIKGEENKWRRRVGSYRIFYFVHQESSLIEILEIERRGSNTY